MAHFRPTRVLATAAVLAMALWSAHGIAPAHPHPWESESALAAVPCEVRVRVDGTEQWLGKPVEFCVGATAEPTITAVATATRLPLTVTPQATFQPTVKPTLPPEPTSVPTSVAEMIEGVPLCTDHDAMKWHPLVKRDAANAITCTYGHEHHDNPSTADDIFGPVGAWYSGNGQTISYPWQTFSTAGQENDVKHNGYKWYVARDINLPCAPNTYNGCIIAYRAEVHAMGTASDAIVRFHSFSEEVLVEMNGMRGIFRYGGWMDTGHLALLVNDGANFKMDQVCPPVASNPPQTEWTCRPQTGSVRVAGSANVPAPYHDHAVALNTWYAQPVRPIIESWGPIDYNDPAHQLFYPTSDTPANNSMGKIESLNVSGRDALPAGSTRSADGKSVSFRGYTDRTRNFVSGCTQIGVDCFPISYEAVPYGDMTFHEVGPITREFDVPSPINGRSLIRFPN